MQPDVQGTSGVNESPVALDKQDCLYIPRSTGKDCCGMTVITDSRPWHSVTHYRMMPSVLPPFQIIDYQDPVTGVKPSYLRKQNGFPHSLCIERRINFKLHRWRHLMKGPVKCMYASLFHDCDNRRQWRLWQKNVCCDTHSNDLWESSKPQDVLHFLNILTSLFSLSSISVLTQTTWGCKSCHLN